MLELSGNSSEIVSYGYEIVAAGGHLASHDENLPRKKKKAKTGRPSGELERERIFMVSAKHLDAAHLKSSGFLFT